VRYYINLFYKRIEDDLIKGKKAELLNIYEFNDRLDYRWHGDLATRYIGRYRDDYVEKEHYVNKGGYLIYRLSFRL
jgi:hypothetical protein